MQQLFSYLEEFEQTMIQDGKYEPRKWKGAQQLRKKIELSESDFQTVEEKIWALKTRSTRKPTCYCGNITNFISVSRGYRKFCSKKCAAQSSTTKEKIKNTNSERWGGHYTKNAQWQRDFVRKCKDKGSYEKMMKTFSEKYGVTNRFALPEVKASIISTNIERMGVDNPLKSASVREKIEKTCMERYGVSHPMQSPAIFQKCQEALSSKRFSIKVITLPSGQQRKVQGYEPFVIDYYLKAGIHEDDLITDRQKIPVITYEFQGKIRKYFPDIFIVSHHLLVEVKSTYTWQKDIEKNLAKHHASISSGYNHGIIIWEPKLNCIDTII